MKPSLSTTAFLLISLISLKLARPVCWISVGEDISKILFSFRQSIHASKLSYFQDLEENLVIKRRVIMVVTLSFIEFSLLAVVRSSSRHFSSWTLLAAE